MPFDRNELQQMQSLYSLISENHTPETSEAPETHSEKTLSELSKSDLYMALETLRTQVMKDYEKYPKAGDEYGNGTDVNDRQFDAYLSTRQDPRNPHINIATTIEELRGLNFDGISDPEEKADFESLKRDILMWGEMAAAGYNIED